MTGSNSPYDVLVKASKQWHNIYILCICKCCYIISECCFKVNCLIRNTYACKINNLAKLLRNALMKLRNRRLLTSRWNHRPITSAVSTQNFEALVKVLHRPSRTIEAADDFRFSIGRQSTGDVSYKPSSRLPLVSARPAVTFPASERHRPWLVYTDLNRDACVWTTCLGPLRDSGTAEDRTIERATSRPLVQHPADCVTIPRVRDLFNRQNSDRDLDKKKVSLILMSRDDAE